MDLFIFNCFFIFLPISFIVALPNLSLTSSFLSTLVTPAAPLVSAFLSLSIPAALAPPPTFSSLATSATLILLPAPALALLPSL